MRRRWLKTVGLGLLASVACSRPSATPPPDALAVGLGEQLPVVPTVADDAGAQGAADAGRRSPCAWGWDARTDLSIGAPGGEVSAFEAVCTGRSLVAVWQRGATISTATRVMEEGARWGDPIELSREAVALGTAHGADNAAWVSWELPGNAIRVASLRNEVLRRSDALVLGRVPAVRVMNLHGQDNLALVAVTLSDHGQSRVLLVRVSMDGMIPAAGAMLGEGSAVATAPGPEAFLAVAKAEPGVAGRSVWRLTGWRVSSRLAGAFGAAIRPGQYGALPEGAATALGSVSLGVGRFEVAPSATREGAVLVQNVLGAERGIGRVAWIGDAATSALVSLETAPNALAGLESGRGGEVFARYWDEQNALVRTRFDEARTRGAPTVVASPLPDVNAVLAASHGTRVVRCGGVAWRLTMVTARAGEGPQVVTRCE